MSLIESLAFATPEYVYLFVFCWMTLNGFFSTPSSQVLYLFIGYLISYGNISYFFVVVSGALGNTAGNILIYELVRRKGLEVIQKNVFLKKLPINKITKILERGGGYYIFLGKLVPTIKVGIPVAAGLTALKRHSVYIMLFLSSLVWAGIFLYVGFLFGEHNSFGFWYGGIALSLTLIAYLYALRKNPELFSFSNKE